MVAFPNAKINIGLNIVGKRHDGYHNLQTIFYLIAFNDVLEIIEHKGEEAQPLFAATGIAVPGDSASNLCVKAYGLLKKDFPQLPSANIHLHKCIPMGAGMGGGSADAAFTLTLLSKKFSLNIPAAQLQDYALQLGSDCPFFLINKPCLATGRGEVLQTLSIDLSAYKILIVHPGIHISTALAFTQVTLAENQKDLAKLIAAPVVEWRNEITNDFEKPVFYAYPEIADIKNKLYSHGAIYASMSGSGSTVYGIFPGGDAPPVSFPAHYFQKWV